MTYRVSRRGFLQHSTAAAVLGLGHRSLFSPIVSRPSVVREAREVNGHLADPATVQTLALRAIDVARSAGAHYADVRLTRTLIQSSGMASENIQSFTDSEMLGLGVRALVQGYWGFAACPYWEPDEVVRVAQLAVAQAKVNALGTDRPVELGTYPVVTGSWIMPVEQDPFRISTAERQEFCVSLGMTANRMLPRVTRAGRRANASRVSIECVRQERAVATTEGSYFTQTIYNTGGGFGVLLGRTPNGIPIIAPATGLGVAGRGWEMIAEARLLEQLPALLEEAEELYDLFSHTKPVDVGRYDVVCDAATMGRVVDQTFGRATEVDRALGYEANASGTSYLGPDPFAFLGTPVASPLVHVTGNRSLKGGIATVQWDDEGVVPEDFPIVSAGTLVDYQTTREQAAWLAPWYQQHGRPARSHGCASAEDALSISMQMTPNLALTPSASSATLADLIAGTEKGIALIDGAVETDFQSRNGILTQPDPAVPFAFEIKNGKRIAALTGAGLLFNSTDFWKNITALGGAPSVEHIGCTEEKGEPNQRTLHTVSAVPAAIKNQSIIDRTRKA